MKRLLPTLLVLLASGCGSPDGITINSNLIRHLNSSDQTEDVPKTPILHVCSKLQFEDLTWPANISPLEADAMLLALNISGSYEGAEDWGIITNNFDGQGLSLGLLNQCLGQGSLQPLMIAMREKNPSGFQAAFTPAQHTSILEMLKKWQGSAQFQKLDLSQYGFSDLDDEDAIAALTGLDREEIEKGKKPKPKPRPPVSHLAPRDQASVDWAGKTIYSDKKGLSFVPEWQVALQKLANTSDYRSIQLFKAMELHVAAKELYTHFKMTQLRSYTFFFDLEVQNGGIAKPIIDEIDKELGKHKDYTETQRLMTILKIRLKVVKKRYVTDVRARKTAIINGTGVVHGIYRDFSNEYCANVNQVLPPIVSSIF